MVLDAYSFCLPSQANLPLSDINRQDNKTLRAQFHIIFSNQRLISCQFAFTLSRMWRFYHHAVKESQAGTTGALISYTYCLHEMVCTYILPKWWNIFTKVTSRPPPTFSLKWIFHWFFGIGGHSKQKKPHPNAIFTAHFVCMFFQACWAFSRFVDLISWGRFIHSSLYSL